ncbi:hypothetical protein FRB99_003357 [Tulasnella sp. 403]|nr:hypothetical protein FRB99_003357 [Tulasnella sp. 403]
MTYGWFVSAGLIYALIPRLSFLSSLVIAACLTPTDPILAAAVVGGKYANKHVPAHLRHILAAESGCNDGAAFPFLFIAIYLTLEKSDAHAVGEWFYITWLYEVLLGIIFGAILGYGFRHLMKFCERKNLIDRHSYVAQYISLAMLAIGATTLLGSDDLLAAFSCGTAFAWDGWFNRQTEESQFSNVIDLLFNCACFIYIGAWIPFNDFNVPELTISPWRLVVIAILVLLLRRLPIMIALYRWIPDVKTFREAIFSGHFGPIGVGAVFISTLASTKLPPAQIPPHNQVELLAASIQPIIAFMSIDPAAPEWATQVRRLPSRREDIVINRDEKDSNEKDVIRPTSAEDRMERGTTEKEKGGSDSSTQTAGASGSGTRTPVGDPITEDIGETRVEGEEGPKEWREGRDLIVEAPSDNTDEVNVKVFKNVFTDENGNMADSIASKVKSEVKAFKATTRKEASQVEEAVNIGAGPSNAPAGHRQDSSEATSVAPPTSRARGARPSTADEEWNDEPLTEADKEATRTGVTIVIEEPEKPLRGETRSISPQKPSRDRARKHVFGHSRIGRRRDSVRRALFSVPKKKQDSNNSDEGASSVEHSVASSPAASTVDLTAEDSLRGRSPDVSVPGSRGLAMSASRRSSMRPTSRVGSRTASPASRIRFADEQEARPSGSGIVRSHSGLMHSTTANSGMYSGQSGSTPSSPNSGPGESSKVMFDLPDRRDRA